uniref:GTP-binding protein Rheb n=1 Tax=Piliocolobus tephrosceles TaxID=591936 RepID=A0A8C9J5G9_9PRIM
MPQSKSRKIAILGYRSVGKSSLTIQFVEGQFVDSYDPTIENTFTKLITVNGQEYHLQLVDTAGQDEYSIFPQTYSIDINGYILVYSVTSIKSFEVIKVIHGKLLDMVGKVQIPIMLVGNKKDLHMERVISYEEGKALAESWNAAFLESSAKENQTAVDVFRRIILEAEKMDGAASQDRRRLREHPCLSLSWNTPEFSDLCQSREPPSDPDDGPPSLQGATIKEKRDFMCLVAVTLSDEISALEDLHQTHF